MIEESKRNYTLTDAELAMFASNLVVFMNRDAAEFAAKGVDAAAIGRRGRIRQIYLALPLMEMTPAARDGTTCASQHRLPAVMKSMLEVLIYGNRQMGEPTGI